jgi:acyl-CoA synthetase (AMP-forming)/AMP-acid ligase II
VEERILMLAGKQSLPDIPAELPEVVVDERTNTPLSTFPTIAAILRYRAFSTPKEIAFIQFDERGKEIASISYEKLNSRAEKIAHYINDKMHVTQGANIALLYKRADVLEYIVAFFSCIFAGCVAVPIISVNDDIDFQHITFILSTTNAKLGLTLDACLKPYAREIQLARTAWPPDFEFVKSNEVSGVSRRKGTSDEPVSVNTTEVAYIEYSQSIAGEVKGAIMTHFAVMSQCKTNKVVHGMGPSDVVMMAMEEPRQHIGCLMGMLLGVYNGSLAVYAHHAACTTAPSFLSIVAKTGGECSVTFHSP